MVENPEIVGCMTGQSTNQLVGHQQTVSRLIQCKTQIILELFGAEGLKHQPWADPASKRKKIRRPEPFRESVVAAQNGKQQIL